MRAPYSVSEAYIVNFVAKHANWIAQKQKALKTCRLSLTNGAKITLFGTSYTIFSGKLLLADGKIFLPESERDKSFIKLLKRLSYDVMNSLTGAIAARYGFSYQGVKITSARGRWGSCNQRAVIAYTFRIAFLPPDLCEYIAVHELAHTVYMNHGKEFWREVEKILPDWKQRRIRLKTYGTIMEWL